MEKPQKDELVVKISPSIVIFIFLFLASIWFVGKIKNVLFITFIAYIISVGLNKPISSIQDKFHWKRSTSSVLVYFLLAIIAGIFLALIVPPLVGEFSTMLSSFKLPAEIDIVPNSVELNLQDISQFTNQWKDSVSTAISVVGQLFLEPLL